MEYNEFIKGVVEELKKFYGEDYKVEVTEHMIRCDTSYDGLVIKDKNGEESPVFHLTDLYNRIQDIDLEEGETEVSLCVEYITEYYTGQRGIEMSNRHKEFEEILKDFEKCKDRIVFTLVNKENNKRYLENIVYYNFDETEMAIVFEVDYMDMCKKITPNHMKRYGVTLEELKELAKVNTPKIRKAVRHSLYEILISLSADKEKTRKNIKGKIEHDAKNMFVISTEDKYQGSSVVLYPDYLKNIADELGDDLLVVFASSHEVVVLRKRDYKKSLSSFAYETDIIYPFEYLSDRVYLYKREENFVTIYE